MRSKRLKRFNRSIKIHVIFQYIYIYISCTGNLGVDGGVWRPLKFTIAFSSSVSAHPTVFRVSFLYPTSFFVLSSFFNQKRFSFLVSLSPSNSCRSLRRTGTLSRPPREPSATFVQVRYLSIVKNFSSFAFPFELLLSLFYRAGVHADLGLCSVKASCFFRYPRI